MMIDGIDFHELEPQRYWSFPSSYKKDKKEETRNMIFSGEYVGSRKMDGALYKFVKGVDGEKELLGRSRGVNGDFLNKIEWVPQFKDLFDALPNGTCLLGEVYFPDNEGSNKVTTIMGCLKDKAIQRQVKKPLHYYIFDVLAYDGHSLLSKDILNRTAFLNTIYEGAKRTKFDCGYDNTHIIELATYYRGGEIWTQLQEILASGGEGMVITKIKTPYSPGKRPSRQTLKIKKELKDTLDVFFTGKTLPPTIEYTGKEVQTWKYWLNTLTNQKILDDGNNVYKDYTLGRPIIPVTKGYFYDWAGSLEVGVYDEEKDEVHPIGYLSGLSDKIKADPQSYVKKPFEMTAMEILETGGIRHGKFLGWRKDKDWKECTYKQIKDR